jgi:hypothetical protein
VAALHFRAEQGRAGVDHFGVWHTSGVRHLILLKSG